MNSSGSQNQRKERFLKVLASQGKSPSLVQSRRRTSKYSHEPESNQTNVQTFDGSGSYASTFSPSTQVRFNPSSRDVSSSVSALKAGLGRISSTPIFRNLFSSYSFPVRTADEPPPHGQSDSLTDDFCSSSDALILPETPMMDTGGSFGVHQWGPLDTNLFDIFTTGAEAPPGSNAIPNMELTMNTETPSHIAASGQLQSSDLVDHSIASEYAGYSVPRPFPPATLVNSGDQPNGPQPPGYWRPQAQVQAYPSPYLPCNSPSGPPPEAASTSRISTSANQNEPQGDTPPSSPGDGISLERPLRPLHGTVVEVRRDACVKIRFDMVEISRNTSTEYAGLKIPCTLSVKNRETTSEHKLLGLQILVFGTVSGLQYESICDDCQKKENRPGSQTLIDFHSKSDVILPLRNSDDKSICIYFNFHCYPKHYNNDDSGYRLEVLLCDQDQQDSSTVRFRLPYTFNIVAKRTRDQFELENGGNLPDPPRRNTRRRAPRDNGFVRTATSCSVRPSTQDQRSSGSSGGLDNFESIFSQTNNPDLLPTGVQDRVSPAALAESSRASRTLLPSATVEETMDGIDAVIEGTNPGRGPTTGGLDIWIYGSNLPDGSRPLYARFGDNVTRVNILQAGLLSCKLPSRRDPGKVPVWLSRAPTADAPPFGESLCEFEYYKPLNEIVSTLVRILEVPNPQQAAVLEVLMKEATSSSQEGGDRGQSDQRGGMTDNDIERAIIRALEPLQTLANFDELVSMANDYNQTLAHFAGLSGYSKLLRRLVEWNIDLTIADVNGLTPLHCAYKGGCRVCVELLLDAGASGTVLDTIGKTSAGLLPDNFEWQMGAVSLDDSTDSIDKKSESNSVIVAKPGHNSEGGSSGNDISDHDGAYDNKARQISILDLHDAVGIRGDPRHEQAVADSPSNEADGELTSSPLAENKTGIEITPVTIQQHGGFFDFAPAYRRPISNMTGNQGQDTSGHPPKPSEAERYKQRYLNRRTPPAQAPSTTFAAAPSDYKRRPNAPLLHLTRSASIPTSTREPQRYTAGWHHDHGERSPTNPILPAIVERPLPVLPRRTQYPRKPPSNTQVHFNIQPPKSASHATSSDPQSLTKIPSNSRRTMASLHTMSTSSSSTLVHRASPQPEHHSSPKTPLKNLILPRINKIFKRGRSAFVDDTTTTATTSSDQQRRPTTPTPYRFSSLPAISTSNIRRPMVRRSNLRTVTTQPSSRPKEMTAAAVKRVRRVTPLTEVDRESKKEWRSPCMEEPKVPVYHPPYDSLYAPHSRPDRP